MSFETREQWLVAATDTLRNGMFKQASIPVPDGVKLSIGWPKGHGGKHKAIGQAWHGKASADGKPHVFISPELSEPVRVLDVLVHELIHTAYPDDGHKGNFPKAMAKLGLTGKPTATEASPELKARLERLNADLGEYPHAALRDIERKKKQSTRMIKCKCIDCGYTVRTSRQWLETSGAPLCPCNGETMGVEV